MSDGGSTLSVEDQFEGDERALLKRIQELLDVRMKDKRKRYVHSLGVAETALHLAEVYGVDRFDAAAAGLIHDWDKVLSDDELVARALCTTASRLPVLLLPRRRFCMALLPPMSFRSFFPSCRRPFSRLSTVTPWVPAT